LKVLFAPGWARSKGVELKAERRKPSGEKHSDIDDIPSLTGVLAHFRLHQFNAILQRHSSTPFFNAILLCHSGPGPRGAGALWPRSEIRNNGEFGKN
jgi:hypothetical protein